MKMLFLLGLLLISIALFGCTPQIVYQPKEVKVPIPVSCVKNMPSQPVWRVPLVKKAGTYADKTKAMAHDLDAAHAYIGELEAILVACQ